ANDREKDRAQGDSNEDGASIAGEKRGAFQPRLHADAFGRTLPHFRHHSDEKPGCRRLLGNYPHAVVKASTIPRPTNKRRGTRFKPLIKPEGTTTQPAFPWKKP